jgi:hypothetical protein
MCMLTLIYQEDAENDLRHLKFKKCMQKSKKREEWASVAYETKIFEEDLRRQGVYKLRSEFTIMCKQLRFVCRVYVCIQLQIISSEENFSSHFKESGTSFHFQMSALTCHPCQHPAQIASPIFLSQNSN